MEVKQYVEGMELRGLIAGVPNEVYHASEGISSTGLKLMLRSPAHYRFQAKREPSRAMHLGTAIHTALLEPDRFRDEYVMLSEVTDRRSSAYKEAIKHHSPEVVLTGSEADKVAGMQESAYANLVVRELLSRKGHRELSLFTVDPQTGVKVRVRYDLLAGLEAVDVKSTQDARPAEFSKSILNYSYHMQAALYLDAWEWENGRELEAFRFVAIETDMPHAAMVYRIDGTALMEGRRMYRAALDAYFACEEEGYWDAYLCGTDEVIGLPEWRVRQIENELLEELV